jgi:hypothetical protein
MTEYVTVAETAKLVRAALKEAFPGVKFSVRSTSYSGGSSVRAGWADGPQVAEVDKVVQPLAEGYRSRYIFTEREFSDEYRRYLERAVVFLSGETGPFDGNRRYEFGIIPEGEVAGRAYEDDGDMLVWHLSKADPEVLESALRAEAQRRAGNTVIRFNAEHAEDRTGFYVTVADGGKAGTLLGPYAAKADAEADVPAGKQLAEAVNDRAVWYAYGVTKVTMKPGQDLPAGKLEHLVERQMTLAGASPGATTGKRGGTIMAVSPAGSPVVIAQYRHRDINDPDDGDEKEAS